MSKKDYILLADAFGLAVVDEGESAIRVAHRIVDALKQDNPRFQRTKFLAAIRARADYYQSL